MQKLYVQWCGNIVEPLRAVSRTFFSCLRITALSLTRKVPRRHRCLLKATVFDPKRVCLLVIIVQLWNPAYLWIPLSINCFCPLLEKFCPLLEHFAQMGSGVPRWSLFLPTFEFRPCWQCVTWSRCPCTRSSCCIPPPFVGASRSQPTVVS